MFIFDNSHEEICHSKSFVNILLLEKNRCLSTIYIKHNLFHQSKLGRDAELQNKHIVLFKFPREVIQVSRLSAQLSLVSELVDWYRDATAVPCGHLLIDLSPRTDDRLRYCTNTGSIPTEIYIPDRRKKSKFSDDEHNKSLWSSSCPSHSPQLQKSLPSVLPKGVNQVPLWMYSKSSQGKPAKHKRTSRDEISKQNLVALCKKKHFEA